MVRERERGEREKRGEEREKGKGEEKGGEERRRHEAIRKLVVLSAAWSAVLSLANAHMWQYDPITVTDADISCDSTKVDHSNEYLHHCRCGVACRTWNGEFAKILSDLLESSHPGKYDVRDCGVCGTDAVQHGHGNIRHASYWDQKNHKESLAINPDVMLFMLGTNDADEWGACANSSIHCGNTRNYYEQDWTALVKSYIALPAKPKVHTMTPPPYFLPRIPWNWTCPKTCPAFTDQEQPASHAANNKELAKACVIDCILPKLVPELTVAVGLAPPVRLTI